MIAIGCFAPFVLAILGAVVGHFLAGSSGAVWGLAIGFLVGGGLLGYFWNVIARAKEENE